MKIKKKIKDEIWSLNIPLQLTKKDKDILSYFSLCKEKLGLVPNIIKVNATNKKRFESFNIFYNRIMQDENFLTKIEKEMIAVVVSSVNRCLYCCISHCYNLSKLLNDKVTAKKILVNFKSAGLSKKHMEMLCFVNKLTISSDSITNTDRNKLRKLKFSEEHILEIIEVCSFFNMTNRIASGSGLLPNKEYYF